MTTPLHLGLSQRISHLRAASRIASAIAASALITVLLLPVSMTLWQRAVASWDGFAVVALVLTWTTILTLKPEQICTLAQREDPSRLASLVLVVLGATASLIAVVVLLQEPQAMQAHRRTTIALALSGVALAWLLIHTVFTLRYAHVYYDGPEGERAIEWPGDAELPDYLDFAYFAFVIGMTAQTADVNIRGRRIRRTALAHGIVAFAFNTAVLALSIGVLTSLLQ